MLNIKNFDFFAFDFDGTLVDSHPVYLEKDKLYIKHFYSQDISRNFLEQLGPYPFSPYFSKATCPSRTGKIYAE